MGTKALAVLVQLMSPWLKEDLNSGLSILVLLSTVAQMLMYLKVFSFPSPPQYCLSFLYFKEMRLWQEMNSRPGPMIPLSPPPSPWGKQQFEQKPRASPYSAAKQFD